MRTNNENEQRDRQEKARCAACILGALLVLVLAIVFGVLLVCLGTNAR